MPPVAPPFRKDGEGEELPAPHIIDSLKAMRNAPHHAALNGRKRMRIYGVCRSAYVENKCMRLHDPRETEHAQLWHTFVQEHATELRSEIVAREHERMAREHA